MEYGQNGDMRREAAAEAENFSSRVLLHIFRHEQRTDDRTKPNKEQLLTEAGRKRALAGGKKYQPEKTAIAIGSDFPRAQETAGFTLAGAFGAEDVTGDESLEELRTKLDKGRKVGTVIGSDPRLGFEYYNDEYMKAREDAYDAGRGLAFNVYESDALAEKLGDAKSITGNRGAANMAEVLMKYAKVGANFDKIISDPAKQEQYGKVLERFIASHMGTPDVFLAKAIEKIKGVSERDQFIQVLQNQGFSPREGFDVEIDTITGQDEPQIRIKYEKVNPENNEMFYNFDEVVPLKILQEMIEEGKVKE